MISCKANIGKNVTIKEGVIVEDNVTIGDNCYLDYGVIIRENVVLGEDCFVGARCILGELLADFHENKTNKIHMLKIGNNALLRSETIIYGDTIIGDSFQTGHRTTIREKTEIGNNVNIGTLSDIQGDCKIGNYVRFHSNVHIGQKSVIKDYVWVFPYVVLTNDPTPPSNQLVGVTVEEFACICTGSIILPGVHIGKDALVGACANVTKNVQEKEIVVGNPAKCIGFVDKIKDLSGEAHYPWRLHFDRGMPWDGVGYNQWKLKTEETMR